MFSDVVKSVIRIAFAFLFAVVVETALPHMANLAQNAPDSADQSQLVAVLEALHQNFLLLCILAVLATFIYKGYIKGQTGRRTA